MNGHDPSVLRRLLILRQCSVFSGAELAELAVIAENATEMVFAAGAMVDLSQRPLHLVVEGQLAAKRDALELSWGPRDACGILELLAGRPLPSAIASIPTRTLELDAADFDDILEDNFGLLSAVTRALAVQVAGVAHHPRIVRPDLAEPGPGPLGLVERLIVLRRLMPFASARLHPLSMLAHAATEVHWPRGTIIARAGEPANHLLVILAGRVCETTGTHVSVASGAAIGALEALGGFAHGATLETAEPVHALSVSGAKLFDIMEDHTDLALSIISALARMLLDAPLHLHAN
jgi:CRP-like cAMP-binding protein